MYVWIVSKKNRSYFDDDYEEFQNIRVFDSYEKAFHYIQVKEPTIYKDSFSSAFTDKKREVLYRIQKFEID